MSNVYSNGKLNLVNIGSNKTELRIGSTSILFSYQTPVAGYDDQGAFRTKDWFSSTTTKHINNFSVSRLQGQQQN